MFCSSTKSNDASPRRSAGLKKRRASSAVPIPHAMFRSPSELQLSVDEKVADERDFVFYARLMCGIRERTQATNRHVQYNEETERCLTHIMQTRHQPECQLEDDGVPILRDEDGTEKGSYYLDDLDSSSSYSSSSTYQQDFEPRYGDGIYEEENECIFDLELWPKSTNDEWRHTFVLSKQYRFFTLYFENLWNAFTAANFRPQQTFLNTI